MENKYLVVIKHKFNKQSLVLKTTTCITHAQRSKKRLKKLLPDCDIAVLKVWR